MKKLNKEDIVNQNLNDNMIRMLFMQSKFIEDMLN